MTNNDQRTAHGLPVVLVAGIVILSGTALPVGADGTAQQEEMPETPEEFLATLQGLEGTEAFETHSEFEVIRSQAVQDVQVGEFTPDKEERLTYVLELLWTFDDAMEAQETESYDRALTLGNKSRELTSQLRDVPQGEQYALLADIALDRLYEQTAQTLLAEAEETDATPERIELLSQAASAYSQAGATERFGQVAVRVDETTQQFENDLDELNESEDTMAAFLDSCTECEDAVGLITSEHISVFGLYADSLSALAAGEDGLAIADQHALEDAEATLSADHEQATEYSQNLAVASITLILGYSLILGLLVGVVTWRLMLWKRDFADSQHGEVILMGEMLNA